MGPIGIVTNPHAGGGRGPAHLARLREAAGAGATVLQTANVEELGEVVDALARAGCRYWVADGGDGTLHWLITTWYARRQDPTSPVSAAPAPIFLPTRGGSIDFVAHRLRLRGTGPELVARLRARLAAGESPPTVALDCLRVTGDATPEGAPVEHLAFAAALAGVAQRFFDLLYEHPQVRPAHIARLLAAGALGPGLLRLPDTLRRTVSPQLARRVEHLFEPTPALVTVDGRRLAFDRVGSAQAGAIDINLGGIVRAFRRARQTRTLHAQIVGLGPLGIVANLPSVVLGTPLAGRHVYDDSFATLAMEPTNGEPLRPVLDGEPVGPLSDLHVSAGPAITFARP